MFKNLGKTLKIILYSAIIAIPIGIAYFIISKLTKKKNGEEPKPEEVMAEAVAFVNKIINLFSKTNDGK